MRDARPRLGAAIGALSVAVAAAVATGTPSALAAAPVPRAAATAPPPASPSPWPTADAVPPSKPTGLWECIADYGNAVPFCWYPSTDNVGVSHYTVHMKQPDGTFTEVGRVTGDNPPRYVQTGLVAGRLYSFYVVAHDHFGNASEPSDVYTARAQQGLPPVSPSPSPSGPVDTGPPSTPGELRSCPLPPIGTYLGVGVSLCWNSAGDDVGVTGYDVQMLQDGEWITVHDRIVVPSGTLGVHNHVVSGLVEAEEYTFRVRARDAAGFLGPPTAPLTLTARLLAGPSPTPSPSPSAAPAGCEVDYRTYDWDTGFTAAITITNTGTVPIDRWTLKFAFPAGQRLTQGWSAAWSQDGAEVTAVHPGWSTSLPPGRSVQVGFNATHTGTNPAPAGFTLNGASCATT